MVTTETDSNGNAAEAENDIDLGEDDGEDEDMQSAPEKLLKRHNVLETTSDNEIVNSLPPIELELQSYEKMQVKII